jgi:hypothetical protein
MKVWVAVFLACVCTVGCAETQPTAASTRSEHTRIPPKCTACHLAPAEHSLAAVRWPAYLKAHRRRLHLTADDETSLYDILVSPPAAATH